jgi:uncharacterized protein
MIKRLQEIRNVNRSTSKHRPVKRRSRFLLFTILIPGLLAGLVLSHLPPGRAAGTISLTTAGTAYTQDFVTLASTGTSSTVPTGWDFVETGTSANATYTAGAGASGTGDTYSFGATSSTERAFGGVQSGALIPTIGASFTNNTGVTITSFAAGYTGEQWRCGATARTDRIDFQYSLDATSLTTGTWIDVNSLDFSSPNTAAIAALDGNAAGNRTVLAPFTVASLSIANGATFWIRWSDFNASGADDGLSVDDFALTPNPTFTTNPSGTGNANPSTVPAGNSTLLTVTVTPGTNPTSTGITVTGDLSTIGGSGTQPFFDNNTNGDVTAGDNIFSFLATVAGATPASAKSLPITINDAEARMGNTSVSLTTQASAVAVFIHDIQGAAETPNMVGSAVTIRGIVVGDHQGLAGLSGFFVQEELSDWDGNTLTSEGIFVFDGTSPATAVNLGDDVTVTGTVANFGGPPGLTELTSPSVLVNSSGNTWATTVVTLPVATSAAVDFEPLEGMAVGFTQNLYATDVDALGTFGEVGVSVTSPLLIPTNSVDPNDNPASGTSTSGSSNVPAVTAQQSLNNRSRIIIDDGSNKSNTSGTNPLTPIPFLIGTGTNATLRRGDFVANATGVMNYGFGSYRIEPAPTITFTQANPRPAAPAIVGGSNLRIASFNVENYFTTTGTGRGAANAAELTRQRAKIVAALEGLNADVIGLIELQKAGGNVAAADLAAALTALGTVGTYASIADLATLNGTDADIKNGMIYRSSTVSLIGSSFSDTAAPIGDYSRDPLAQRFMLNATGKGFAVVVHHARSKSCPGSGGDADLGDGQACFNDRRRNQSQLVAAFANNIALGTPDVLVIGDINSYAEEDPIDVFRAGGFTDLVSQYVAAGSKYSFTFSGEAGQLDHAFASGSLAAEALGTSMWHIDADEPQIIDYTTTNKPDDRYAVTPYRSSDHDPVLMSFNLAVPTAASGLVSGIVIDANGVPIAGTVVNLNGAQNRKTITNAKGYYQFDNVETSGFYTVTPSRANYTFGPSSRSFSQLGNHTDAAFTGASSGDNLNPLDTPEYFVRQQYLDVLGREPDEDGFNYWSNEILRCGDVGCANARRRDVAASFFIEEEFRDTGSFIYDMYKGTLGRKPVFSEYSSDRKQVIGGPSLATQKAAFADSFVQRAEFVQKYQANTTAESFVDALLQTVQQSSQVDLDGQRGSLINQYNGGANLNQSRSLVLRALADDSSLKQSEYNAAFVLTEYFGYLRRNPEPEGYDFWLNVLNNGDVGNYRGMVCSFITSTEYQKRFSSVVTHSNAECGH